MKRILAIASASLLSCGLANAADLRVRRAPPPAPPPPVYFNWTGCYIGGHVGGLWVSREFTTLGGPFGHVDHDASG
jgi:outer membrane immunogenic protein